MTQVQNLDEFWNTFDQRRNTIMQSSPSPMERFPSQAATGVAQNDMGFWGYSADLVKAVPRGIWGMADSISQGLYYGTGGLIGNDEREAPFGVESWRGHSDTVPGSVLETVSQIYLPFGAAAKGVQFTTRATGLAGRGMAATAALGEEAVIAAAAGQRARSVGLAMAGRTLEVGAQGVKAVAAGAIADTIAFESHAGRLSNLLTTFDNPLLNNAVTQYLAADENDSFLEGKLKNAIEGAMFSGAIESVVGSLRVVRSGLRASRIGQDANAAAFAEHMTIRREQREQIMGALGVNADEAEVINALIDTTGMSRSNLSFVRSAEEAVDEMGKPRRAAVTFKEDGNTVIEFFRSADRSSPVHEVSHVVRRRLLDRTIDPRNRFGVSDLDIKIIEDFVGVREGIWDVASEEKWASLFERYTWDGIAPNRKVAAVMNRASDFMRAVYTNIEAENLLRQANPEEYARRGGNAQPIQINDEVRRVMNKLMSRGPATTDDAIRVFTKAQKKIALAGDGRMYRMMSSMMDRPFTDADARQAFDDVYSEPKLYQSGKARSRQTLTTDEGYPVKRGRDAIMDRVRREVQQGDLARSDGEAMEKLIQNLPEDLTEIMGARFRKAKNMGSVEFGGVVLGKYNRSSNIVSISSDWALGKTVGTTWSHEWVHAMTAFMPDEILNTLRGDYTRAYQKFIRLEGIDPRAKPGTPDFIKLRDWAGNNPTRFEELYSLTNLDEFLAVGLQSKLWRQLDIQEGTRSFIGYARYALHNMMTSIKATYGEGTFDRIAREMMDADYRMAKQRRDGVLKAIGLKNLVRKNVLEEATSLSGESWMTRLQRDLDQRNEWMFRDFEDAASARTQGEAMKEYLPYRTTNRLDMNAEQRTFAGENPPKQPTQTTTLYQSAQDFSPEQRQWAAESKIKSPDGSPTIVYHASKAEAPIRVFDRNRQYPGQFGKGFYFTANRDRAGDYGGNIGAYILDIRKPFDVANDANLRLLYAFELDLDKAQFGPRGANKDTKANWKQYLEMTKAKQAKIEQGGYYSADLLVDMRMSLWDERELSKFNQWLEEKGYDGVIGYHEGRIERPEYVAFRENQIKALENKTPTAGPDTMYQSAFQGQGAPLPQPQRQPLGGQPPDRPLNIPRTSTSQDVRNFIDIRVQELEVDGRVQVNSMTREEMVAAGERELAQIADFTGFRTLPELTTALRGDQDALQQFITRHLAMRNVLSETGQELIRVRDAMLQSNADIDIARFVATQQRYDVILEHTKQNQAIIGRGLGAQSIIPGVSGRNVRLIDDAMLNDPALVRDIVDTAGGRDAVMAMARVSQAAEARGGIAGAARATQGGRHGFMPVLTEYWMNSILSGPITFATNVTSNVATMLYMPAEQALGASLTRNFPLARESMMRYGAMLHEVRDALHYAGITLRTGDNVLDVIGGNAMTGQATQRGRAISADNFRVPENSRTGAFINFLGTVVNAPSSALQATDEFFKQMTYRSTVRARLTADAINEVAQGRLPRDQMGAWVEQRFQRMVDQGQMYTERKIRADANNAARREIDAGTFTENSADHMAFVRDYIRREWNPQLGAVAQNARAIAREATFTTPINPQAPGLEGISGKIQNLVNQHPSMRILIPFVRTPTNIAFFFGQRLPFNGVMYATPGLNRHSTRFSRDMASNDPVIRAAAAGRMAGGTILTVSAIGMAGSGLITGSGPKDPEERAYLMKAGWQPYSVKVGDTYISYRKLDPFATFFGMAADLYEAYLRGDEEDRGFIETTLYGLATAIGQNIANKTYLTGLVTASNAISDAPRNGSAYVNQLFASFIPSLSSQSNELFFEDTAMRDVQTLLDAVKARIPGLASEVAPRRDVLGEVMRKPDRVGLVPPAWPFAFTQTKQSAVIENELAQLGAGFTPPRSMRNDVDMRQYVNRRGQSSYDRWQELTGKTRMGGRTLREAMEEMIQSPGYQQLDGTSAPGYESPRIGVLRTMISQYRDAALNQTLQEFPDLMEAERNRRATVIGARSGKPFADLLQYSRGR